MSDLTITLHSAKDFKPARLGVSLLMMENGNFILDNDTSMLPDIPGLYRFPDGVPGVGRATYCTHWALLKRMES